ncbi:hypothetical protein [Nocardioides cynanchi]|uniref:hypothetical protein n=1 Tax=Nocardioides cynanchi TaxID=2558918 RepID=UPI0012457AB0|nr:hypothetical protein [Nocardioides cynanchi]
MSGLLVVAALAAGASARTTRQASPELACTSAGHGQAKIGHFSGIAHAVSAKTGCSAHNLSDPANGTPPLLFHGGPMMGTARTGPVVVTPIYWHPAGHPMSSTYSNILTGYLRNVAAASGTHTNVFSTLTEYSGSNGAIRYRMALGTPVNDTAPLPANGCTVAGDDTSRIYADGTGYDSCIDDNQVIAETDRVITARGLPRDLGHMYVLFLPKHVESCFFAGSTVSGGNFCTINHHKSGAYCAYHSQSPTGAVYGNMPFPVYHSNTGFTCSSDAVYPAVQTPNGDADADTEVSPTSHEIMEAITDPDTSTGWYDSSGFENGDECAYVFGATQGTAGSLYNQVINGGHYLTQEEFSNRDFAATGGGCLPGE